MTVASRVSRSMPLKNCVKQKLLARLPSAPSSVRRRTTETGRFTFPVRRIRSLSQDSKPPSSILKRSPAVSPPTPAVSPRPQTSPSPVAATAGQESTAGPQSTPSSPRSPTFTSDDLVQEGPSDNPNGPSSPLQAPMPSTSSPPTTPLRAPLCNLVTSPEAVAEDFAPEVACTATAAAASRQLNIADAVAPVTGTSTPKGVKGRGERSPSPRRTRRKNAAAKRTRGHELASPEKAAADNEEARQKHHTVPHRNTRQPEHESRKPSDAKNGVRPSTLQMAKSKVKTLPGPKDLTGQEQLTSSLRVRALISAARPAFIAGAAYAAIFGNIASFSTVPTRGTVLVTLGCRDEECPVNWLRWFAVSLPVAMICCILSGTFLYCARLVSCDDETDEQTHEDVARCARARQRDMKKHTMREALLFYWLVGIPVASSAYATRHPEGLCSRMPWNIILMLGSIMALTKTVEEYRLVEVGLSKLDDHFWTQRSTKASQFILVSLAALLSELIVGESLARSMAATVVRVAVVTETPVSFYVIPVSLAASINVILPVSLPLLIMREYHHQTKSSHMVAYGVFLKCTAVIVIFISMNTIGLILFQGDPPAREHAIFALQNATERQGANIVTSRTH
ncbi:hypothetical protein MTO96_005905 [Rhipicephalus appendiculatus]